MTKTCGTCAFWWALISCYQNKRKQKGQCLHPGEPRADMHTWKSEVCPHWEKRSDDQSGCTGGDDESNHDG